MVVPRRLIYSIVLVLLLVFLAYELRLRYHDPFLHSYDVVSDLPVVAEEPAARQDEKVVVMAKTKDEDADWVARDLPDWGRAIYHMGEEDDDFHAMNKGREAMAYLTYLIDSYDNLPEIIAMVHAHEGGWPKAWHTDAPNYSNVQSLRSLKLDYVKEHGFVNLRCIPIPGCPDDIQPFRNPRDPERMAEHAMAEAWIYVFGGDNSTIPWVIATPCCSQIAVSSKQVRERPKSDYERLRQWLLDTPLDDSVSGRVVEYMWHVLFGREPVYCPDTRTCWCDQFGRCDG